MYCLKTLKFFRRVKNINIPPQYNLIQLRQQNYFSHAINDESVSDKIVEQICKGDAELEKKLRILMLEVDVMREDGRYAPSLLKVNHWQNLLNLPSRSQRNNYLGYLFKIEKSKEKEKAKKEARREQYEESKAKETKEYPDDIQYGLVHQSLFLRIRDAHINKFDNYRLFQAKIHGKPIVLDCSFEQHMVQREIMNAAKQVTLLFGHNRLHREPFDLHMCSVNPDGEFMKQLKINIPTLEDPWFPLNIHTESYLDVFPKEKLVYLTPYCRDELTHYDDDAVYIIGCMVDKVNNAPFSLARAKKDGIKMAKLPLDKYIEWAPSANKSLNVNHMIPIMLDLKFTGDWKYALKHIPRRKLMETKILAIENKLSKNPELKAEILKSFQIKNVKRSHRDKLNQSRKSLLFDNDI